MKIEINHPENTPPPHRNLSNPLKKLNTTEIIPTPPEKIPNTSEIISTPPKNLNPPEKISISLKNSPSPNIAKPSLKQSQTLKLNLNPFPKNPNPL